MIFGLIRDVLFAGIGLGFGLFWLAHGSVGVGVGMLVASGYVCGVLTTSRLWRRDLRSLTASPAPRPPRES